VPLIIFDFYYRYANLPLLSYGNVSHRRMESYGFKYLKMIVNRSNLFYRIRLFRILRKHQNWFHLLNLGKLRDLLVAFSNIVRHSIARVIAAIASIELPNNNWAALLPFLSEACGSSQVNARATGIYILFTILENSTEGFLDHLESLYKLCGRLLDDPESLEVQVNSVRTLGTLAQYIENDEKDQIVR
jgi:hypothetical protein